jgi:phosphatidylglycerol lysyltransferase
MIFYLRKKTHALLWQALFLTIGTTWLWAPILNPGLSLRVSLISQYETPMQPYSILFRIADICAGLLLLLAAVYYLRSVRPKTIGIILAILSAGLILDPVLSTTCRVVDHVCSEYFSISFLLHAVETITTAAVFFAAGIYDSWKRKKVVSIIFVGFQIAYGGLFISQLASQEHFNTLSQYIYQTILIVWLAWYCRDNLDTENRGIKNESRLIKSFTAAWAFLNGILAIVISLAHLNLLGRIKGFYFSSGNAWLAQHGMIIGVIMLYLSRHLARGERRARQIFLLIIGIEAIKYAVVSPNAALLALYIATFVSVFIAKDSFSRGSLPLTWRIRLKDLAFLIAGLLAAAAAALIALDRDDRASIVASRAIDHFSDYVTNTVPLPRDHIRSILLAHSISAFLLAAAVSILWVLFRPNRVNTGRGKNYGSVRQMLGRFSKSSEDYFKFWPKDKDYYWGRLAGGFVAYKIVGSTVFGLADPIGADPLALLNEFNQWCRARRLKVCYLPVYPGSVVLYKNAGLEVMQIGSSAEITVSDFINDTVKEKWWRWKLNQAKKAGYRYAKSLPPHSPKLMRQFKAVSDRWLKVGGHVERGFALGHFDKDYLAQCVIHYLTDADGKAIAFTNELPQFQPLTVKTIDLLRYDPSADKAMPFLLASLIRDTAVSEPAVKVFDLGFVPFAKAKGPLLAIAKAFSGDRFSARGLEQFKNKFNPEWQPNYMAYDGDLADLAVIALNIEKVME